MSERQKDAPPVTMVVPAGVFDMMHDRLKRSGYASRYSMQYERQELDLTGIRIVRARTGVVGSDDPLDMVAEEMNMADARKSNHLEPDQPWKQSPSNTHQVGGQHYGLGTWQHWDIVLMFDLDYFQGNITKYVFRWQKKGGVEDLKKAQHYLQKYIEEIEAGRIEARPKE